MRGATLRECRHRALFLYRRAERLALEQRRLLPPAPTLPSGPVDAAQVWTLIDATLDRLADARGALGLRAPIPPVAEPREVGDDELLAALLEAERAIEALAVTAPSYSEMYLAVTRALGYSSSIRSVFPGRRMPPTPLAQPASTHENILQSLRKCLARTASLIRSSGLPPLGHVPTISSEKNPSLHELRTLAELLEAELGVLYALHGDPEQLPPACDPGPRRSAEVNQRSALLALQLLDLETQARNTARWRLQAPER